MHDINNINNNNMYRCRNNSYNNSFDGWASHNHYDRYNQSTRARVMSNKDKIIIPSENIIIPIIFHILCPVSKNRDGKGLDLDIDIDLFIMKLNDAYTGGVKNLLYYDKTIEQLKKIFNNDINLATQYYDYIHNKQATPPIQFVKHKVITTGKVVKTVINDDRSIKKYGSVIQYAEGYPKNRTLNIWLVDFSDGTLGYTQFPWDSIRKPKTDGVVIRWNTIKKGMYGQNPSYSDNKTAAHEIGHWLGLQHTFVINTHNLNYPFKIENDVPMGKTPIFGNPFKTGITEKHIYKNKLCMFMNFMGYADDDAMFMFTRNQVNKIIYFIQKFRS